MNKLLLINTLSIALLLPSLLLNAAEERPWTVKSGPDRATLLELYTSQGCSSCPGADAWLGKFAGPRLWKGIIPVAWHVDYWNRLGWEDPLSDPAWSARQKAAVAATSTNSVYTPGFFLNGREWRGYFAGQEPRLSSAKAGELQLDGTGKGVQVAFTPSTKLEGKLTVHLVLQVSGVTTDIRRGENSGTKITQDFSALEHVSQNLEWQDGKYQGTLPSMGIAEAAKKWPGGKLSVAAWVTTDREPYAPLQAAGTWVN